MFSKWRQPKNLAGRRRRLIFLLSFVFICLFIFYLTFFQAPADFSKNTVVRIETGMTTKAAAEILQEKAVIKYQPLFLVWLKIFSREKGIIAGDYYFSQPQNVLTIANRLRIGLFDIDPFKITIPEGLTVVSIAKILDNNLPNFDQERFKVLAKFEEGYLFPDTYFFSAFTTEEDIVKEMRRNFDRQLADLFPLITNSGRSLSDIIIMASILEKEARTTESRRIISGILWKRIEAGMRLQVDAVFPYIIGKNTFELTTEDLFYQSLYNTYRHEGLPPGPIANPSRNAIEAALYPQTSPFWFYLSDRLGEMHYATNHDDHIRNKNKYLK